METALRSDYSNPDAENLLFDLEDKGLRVVARSGQLVVKPKKAILTNLHTDLDYDYLKKKLPSNILPAYDGLSFNF